MRKNATPVTRTAQSAQLQTKQALLTLSGGPRRHALAHMNVKDRWDALH